MAQERRRNDDYEELIERRERREERQDQDSRREIPFSEDGRKSYQPPTNQAPNPWPQPWDNDEEE